MKKYLKILFVLIKFNLQRVMAYPKDFLMWMGVDILWSTINVVFFKVIYLSLPTISGWTFVEMVVTLGMIQILIGFIWSLMYPSMKQLTQDANSGKLDLVLAKPVSSQFLISFRTFQLNIFTSLVIGILLIGYGLSASNLINMASLLTISFSVVCMLVITYGSYYIYSSMSLFYDRLNNIADVFPHLVDFGRFPPEIFPITLRLILSISFPLIFVAYTPAKILFKGENIVGLFVMMAIAIVILYTSKLFWNLALRHYSSASS